MTTSLVLFAANWEALIPLIFVVIWVVMQILGAREQKRQQQQPQQGEPRRRPPRPPNAPVQGARGRDERELRDEVEVFLRQSQQRPAAGRRKPPADAEIVEDVTVVDERGGLESTLAGHVTHHLDASGFRERAAHLGEEVGLADEKMEEHLHGVFAHEIGDFASPYAAHDAADLARDVDHDAADRARDTGPSEATSQAASDAHRIANMLRNPQGVRQAVIVSEILHRPADHW